MFLHCICISTDSFIALTKNSVLFSPVQKPKIGHVLLKRPLALCILCLNNLSPLILLSDSGVNNRDKVDTLCSFELAEMVQGGKKKKKN